MSWLNITCVWLNGQWRLWHWDLRWRLWHWRTWRTNLAVKGVLIESITKTPEVGPPPTRQTLDLQVWITPKLETFCAFNAFLGFLLGSRFGFAFSFLQNCRRTTSETRGSVSRYFISWRWLLLFTDVLSLTININIDEKFKYLHPFSSQQVMAALYSTLLY